MKYRFVLLLLTFTIVIHAAHADYGKVELLRDEWGIPHIFAETDAGAFYGLGYAHAEDRAFQMYFSLRIMQGRTAELLGDQSKKKRNTSTITHDKKIRTLGFYRAAKRLVPNLDPETRSFLEAYSAGVNDSIATHRNDLLYLFKKLNLEPEPWTPADSIACWWGVSKFFSGEGLHDTMTYHRLKNPKQSSGGRGNREPEMQKLMERARNFTPPADDAAAVVQRGDVDEKWIEQVTSFMEEMQASVTSLDPKGEVKPSFSHAWVVGGSKTTTGSTVLVSDPQTPVRNPALFHEFHFSGKTFNARGIGVPGSPVILIGWTENVAWGLTALGADQADQFMLKTDADHPNQYFYNGEWLNMTVWDEVIRVKGGEPITLTLKETHYGPVISSIAYDVRRGEDVALKRIPQCETDRETIQGSIAMMRAKNTEAFSEALAGWRFPSANIVFGDKNGDIGYWSLAAIPIRSPLALNGGRATHDGTNPQADWLGIMPYHLLPHVINPKQGYLLSANHRPIASFYPSMLGITTGSGGDTSRSWRLRERLSTQEKFTPEDVLDVHYDSVNIHRREIIHMAYHMRDVLKIDLSPLTLRALNHLETWFKQGGKMNVTNQGSELAANLNTMFRMVNTELTFIHGGGQTGLSLFLKDFNKRLKDDPQASVSELEIEYIDRTLKEAWQNTLADYGRDPKQWNKVAREKTATQKLGYFDSLDGFKPLDRTHDVTIPVLTCRDGGTIFSQMSQSYTQWVPMHDVDSAMSVLPIGQSENPAHPSRLSTYTLWGEGKLHPAPITRKAVESIAKSKAQLK